MDGLKGVCNEGLFEGKLELTLDRISGLGGRDFEIGGNIESKIERRGD